MGRPTVFDGWWLDLLMDRAEGNIGDLAGKLGISSRTLNRWFKMELEPGEENRDAVRRLAGEEFLSRPDCPAWFGGSLDQSVAGLPGDVETLDDEVDPLEEGLTVASGRRIFTDKGDPEIHSLHRQYKRGKLDIQPDFQRQYVWDNAKASRLIESILLDIPLPVVYLSEEADGRTYVIDGQQRLTSIFSFIDGKYPDGRASKLGTSRLFPQLAGKSFQDLDDEFQERISGYKMRTILFLKDSDKDLKYEVFERLNSGSVSLNDQELRNCVYRGIYNDQLKKLAMEQDFRALLGTAVPHKRMLDVELVLRFAAFYHASYLNYRAPMKAFLNRDAERYRHLDSSGIADLETAFKTACSVVRSLFGARAFKRFRSGNESYPNGYWEENRFNASLYDVFMGVFARVDKNIVFQNLDAIREACIDLMACDREFIDAIELSTSSIQAVTKRFDKVRMAVQEIVGVGRKEPRFFSRNLKERLYEANSQCSLCGNRIEGIDDAAVDHIKQYWMGGATTLENARLAHRYCNTARSRFN